MVEFLRSAARAFVKNEALAFIDAPAHPFGDTTFVFPNRRSMKFFQKYLGEEYGKVYNKPLFSPLMLTISELFGELSGLQSIDPIEAQYILYRNYIELKCSSANDNAGLDYGQMMERESFDEFLHWGNAIIADYNDIDKYLVDASQLFTNIKDLKQLDSDYSFLSEKQRKAVEQFWRSFWDIDENSSKKKSFASLWEIMYALYQNFRKELEEKGVGYEGMIYRKVAEAVSGKRATGDISDIEGILSGNDRYKNVVFVGFNAPNRCEKALMRWFKEHKRGDFYWDFYGPMVTDKENKASMFISDAVKEFPSRYELEQYETALPQFNVIGVPSGVGQAFVVSDILKGISADDALKTSVVLPDENLLMPVLNSIPEKFGRVNVTMGFPISATPLMNFMAALSQLQKDVKTRGRKECFYHMSVVELLKHEYVRDAALEESEELVKAIAKHNYVFIELGNELLETVRHPLLKSIFAIPCTSAALLDYLIAVLKELDSYVDTLGKEFIYKYYLAVKRLKELDIPMKKETCLRLLSQITSSITIPFRGEPLAGLQVIGSLETRALDFENVIILNVNEGRFPASSQSDSLIPYNLRVGFSLPTYEVMDAIAAYHFYRSIYRAKNVWLLYDTRSEGIQSGEASRYVKQLKFHYNVDVNEMVVGLQPVEAEDIAEPVVVKTPQVMEKMIGKFVGENGKCLSASSLKTYIACPMRFYLEKIEGIREEDSVSEEIESNDFGTLFHYVMENIYSRHVGSEVVKETIEREIANVANIERLIDEGFKELGVREILGQNLIVREVIKKYVTLTLMEDMKHTPFIYVASEGDFYHRMGIGNGLSVKFIAKIDRIDKKESGSLRVIDYKTSSKKPANITSEIPVMFDGGYERRSEEWIDESFQLYLYAYIIANNPDKVALKNGTPVNFAVTESESSLDMVIYPITKIKDRESIKCESIYKGKLEEFETALKGCIEEIFNKDIPFTAAKSEKSCKYCMFKSICGR